MDKKIKELATEILQEFTSCYSEADEDCLVKMIRKYIPENAVVLTRERYDRLCKRITTTEARIQKQLAVEKARKETAEKFSERLKSEMQERDYMGVKYKQGVFTDSDIDEICKEITDKEVQSGN